MITTDERITRYVLDHYAGWGNMVIKGRTRHMRLFRWREGGDTWIGNRRAFYLHLSRKFGFTPSRLGHDTMNKALVACNERVYPEYDRAGTTSRMSNAFPPAGPLKRRVKDLRRR